MITNDSLRDSHFFPANIAWLNNCVGYANHRYFFMYIVYMWIGTVYLAIFGVEIAYKGYMRGAGDGWFETERLEGHAIRFNWTGHIVPVVSRERDRERII